MIRALPNIPHPHPAIPISPHTVVVARHRVEPKKHRDAASHPLGAPRHPLCAWDLKPHVADEGEFRPQPEGRGGVGALRQSEEERYLPR